MLKLKDNLKKTIRSKGVTVTALSKATKVPLQTIHGWLNGSQPRSIVQVKAVCRFLEVGLDELCFGDDFQTPPVLADNMDEINAGVFEAVLRRVKK